VILNQKLYGEAPVEIGAVSLWQWQWV